MIDRIFHVGLFFIALSVAAFFISFFQILNTYTLVAAFVVIFCVFVYFEKSALPVLNNSIEGFIAELKTDRVLVALFAMNVVLFLLAFVISLGPPVARDDLIVHLALPKLYLNAGGAFEIPFMGFSYYPLGGTLLYLYPLAMLPDNLASLFHLIMGGLTTLLIGSYLTSKVSLRAGLFASLVFVSAPVFFQLARSSYVDFMSIFFLVAALVAILKAKDVDGKKYFYYSAVFIGFAVSIKLNALVAMILIFYMLIVFSKEGGYNLNESLMVVVGFSVIAFAVYFPWALRSFVWKGNLFYPIISSAALNISTGQEFFLSEVPPLAKRFYLYGESLWDIVLVPLRLFYDGVSGSIKHFDGSFGIYLLLLVPFLFFKNNPLPYKNRLIFIMAIFFLITFFLVDLTVRYLYFSFVIFILIASSSFASFLDSENDYKRITSYLVVAAVFIGGLFSGVSYLDKPYFNYLNGSSSRTAYLKELLPEYGIYNYINRTFDNDAKIWLLFAGDRSYYLDRTFYYGDRMGGDFLKMVSSSDNPAQILEKARNMGVTHILAINTLLLNSVQSNLNEEKRAVLNAFWSIHIKPIMNENGYGLYEIVD